MSFNKMKIVFMVGTSLLLFSCNNNDLTPQPQPAPLVVNRLVFTGTANTGGDVRIELDDAKLETVLDGNPNYNGGVLPSPPQLPFHESLITIDITDLNYYGDVVTVNCAASSSNKIPLELIGNAGSFYENTNGVFYLQDNSLPQYLEQQTNEVFLEAVIPIPTSILGSGYYFNTLCTASDGNDYRVSFYDRTNPFSHGITTTFSIVDGTVEGIIRIHRLGEGYHPSFDILL